MAIRDLLWACPFCGTEGGLHQARRGAECEVCGAGFRRGTGAEIVGAHPERGTVRANPADWLDRLPELEVFGPGGAPREVRAVARFGVGTRTYRGRGEVLGFAPEFGDPVPGRLVLAPWEVSFRSDDEAPNGHPAEKWPLASISAIQASSSAVLLKCRGRPLVTLRFPDGSVRFWQDLLEEALRAFYRKEGRGDIREFRPTIVTR